MSDASTIHLIDLYNEESESPLFLSGFFKTSARNFHTTEKVEVDVIRDDEDVAVAIQDLSTGARLNESTVYTNKGFTPPIFDEEGVITAYNQIKRQPGVDPFQNPNFAANAVVESFRIFRRLERKIRRSIELMASQVLQTGTLTLTDKTGASVYTLDFKAKTSHIATASAPWAPDGTTGDPLADINALSTAIRRDGKKVPDVLVFGTTAFNAFLANPAVQKLYDLRRADRGDIIPARRGAEGATYHGTISVGHYVYELWTYDGFYRDPQTGDFVPYVTADKVIMLSSSGRLDLSFGAIPMIRPPEERAMGFLPPRISNAAGGFDLTTNAYFTPDGKHLRVGAGTRPLTIPTAIDTFGCLDVG